MAKRTDAVLLDQDRASAILGHLPRRALLELLVMIVRLLFEEE